MFFSALIVICLTAGVVIPKMITGRYQSVNSNLAFSHLLSAASTPLNNNAANRRDNIILTCEKINQTVLMPGEVFSFNKIVGNRTQERGFKPAPSFANGRIIESVGGGICQVSSTLYYACLLADLEIVSRTSHSMCPDYIKNPGLDATVEWGVSDYRFKNNTEHPVKIFTAVEDLSVFIKIMGTKTNDNTVIIESRIISSEQPETIYRDNPALAPDETVTVQPSFVGYISETYRIVADQKGEITKCTLESKDSYKKLDKIIERGPG